MKALAVTAFAVSTLLLMTGIAEAQAAHARIDATPIRGEANLASPVIATLKEGDAVDVVDRQGEWYRVLVPGGQGKPRVGYVLANLIEIVTADGSPQSIPTPPTRNAERPMSQGQPIPPTMAQITLERTKATERVQAQAELDAAKAELDAARAELGASQADSLGMNAHASAQPIPQAAATPAAAQVADFRPSRQPSIASVVKSASAKFFLGGQLEGTGIVTSPTGSASIRESGAGLGLVLGYGFTPIWALYGTLSGADISDINGDSFALGHFDIGVRAHFLTGPHVVVPFVQAGLSGRVEAQTVTDRTGQHDLARGGAGPAFGGGLNIHVRPALAISTGVTWSVGDFSVYTSDNQTIPGTSVSATSARVHVGIIWFPQTHAVKD